MKKEYLLIILAPLFIIGAILYWRYMSGPVGGFMLEYIISPIGELLFPNPNMAEGLLFWIFGLGLLYALTYMPYVGFCLIVLILYLFYSTRKKPVNNP